MADKFDNLRKITEISNNIQDAASGIQKAAQIATAISDFKDIYKANTSQNVEEQEKERVNTIPSHELRKQKDSHKCQPPDSLINKIISETTQYYNRTENLVSRIILMIFLSSITIFASAMILFSPKDESVSFTVTAFGLLFLFAGIGIIIGTIVSIRSDKTKNRDFIAMTERLKDPSNYICYKECVINTWETVGELSGKALVTVGNTEKKPLIIPNPDNYETGDECFHAYISTESFPKVSLFHKRIMYDDYSVFTSRQNDRVTRNSTRLPQYVFSGIRDKEVYIFEFKKSEWDTMTFTVVD